MEGYTWLVVVGVLALMGFVIGLFIYSLRKGRAATLETQRSLGFTPEEPAPDLVEKLARLYDTIRFHQTTSDVGHYRLLNVSRKRMPDCDMVLFDLVDTSGDDTSTTEKQAVAVISHHLHLPPFVVFPKLNTEGALTDLANRVMGYVVAKFGQPVEFPQVPEFDQRYFVSSPDPAGVRQVLDESRLRRLAKTGPAGINACGDTFTLSRIDLAARPIRRETIGERVSQAMDVLSIFLS